MVSSDVDLCSTMGKEILLRGGNAADASVTVALCVGSINSGSSGIGGGGFIVSSSNSTKKVLSIDAREMAPGMAYSSMFEKNPVLSVVGGLSNGIPGELKGLDVLFHTHGSGNLTWAEVIEPVIRLNRDGFECTLSLEVTIQALHDRYFTKIPDLAKSWDFIYNEDGSLKKVGQLVQRQNLARTLELVAQNGSSAIFYDPNGPIVPHLIEANNKWGGLFTSKDFALYETKVEDALSYKFGDLEVYTTSGISSGIVLIAGLNLYSKLQKATDASYLQIHKFIETMKWMASARTRLGDTRTSEEYQEIVSNYTSDSWSEDIRDNKYFDTQTFHWSHYDPLFQTSESHGTTHFSVLDDQDNGVGMTSTVNLLFGSIVYDPITGVILNNEMDDFSTKSYNNSFQLQPSKFNTVQPYNRPLSSAAPTIIMENGIPIFLVGAAGGSRITTAVLQAIMRVFNFNSDLLSAIANPRLHHQLLPNYVLLENITLTSEELGYGVLEQLEGLGHTFQETGVETTMNAIHRVRDTIHGVADFWRKFGEADGY
ncbi:hypothetical protein PSN45_001961 [Yamadazyma tenuis]|nr:hypothetical protein PSN45_001961 [Yamadazyma tenuis]